MSKATCIGESVYGVALTRGRKYEILALDEAKRQVKVEGNSGRTRWFPVGCFDLTGADAPVLSGITVRDALEPESSGWVEVDVELSDGQRRWCWFVTPALLMNTGERLHGTDIQAVYGVPHLIVVNELTEEVVVRVLRHIDRQGELLNCTQPIEEASSSEIA